MSTPDSVAGQSIAAPRVTVVIPCHNHADMLPDAIKSVFIQDYRPIKICVVDDGSSDNPQSVLKGLDGGIEITVITNESPRGPSAARNIAVDQMWDHTDLFVMLDADDLYLQGKIRKSVEKFLEYPEHTGIVYTDAVIKNIHTGSQVHEFRRHFDREELEKECIISNTPMISKSAFQKCGGYDEGMRTCEDWDLWLRITENFMAIHIPERLHVYHVTGKNSSDIVSQEVWQENWAKINQRIAARKHGSSH